VELTNDSTYPSAYAHYPDGYSVTGIIPISTGGVSACLTDPYVTWAPEETSKLTQPPLRFPKGGDKYGIFWTMEWQGFAWPDGWLASRSADQAAWKLCETPIHMKPAHPQSTALVLTETEVSTKKANAAASPVRASKQPPVTTTAADTGSGKPEPSKTPSLPPTTQTVVIGTQTQALSISYLPNTATTPTTVAANEAGESAAPPQPATEHAPAVVIGTDTVTIGATATINGVQVVATTAPDSHPQILVGGASGTSTIDVVAGGAQTTDKRIGAYIASGLNGAPTDDASGAQFTGVGAKTCGVGTWYWVAVGFAVVPFCW
jgi:hypothetical protein